MARWIKWGAIALLVAAVSWLSYSWGWEASENEQAQAREKAVRDAVAEYRRERAKLEQEAELAERERLASLRDELVELRDADRRLREFEASEPANRECLPPDVLEDYRSY